jgi:hypothetical protein
MKHQTEAEPATALFPATPDFKGFSGDSDAANLSAPGTGEIQNATESGAELIWTRKTAHVDNL